MSPLLSVRDLAVSFPTTGGRARVVDGLSFDLRAGETIAILGESGSGKSVTAQAIMGILPRPAGLVERGEIVFDGLNLLTASPKQARALRGPGIAMVFQDPLTSLNPYMRVGAQISETVRRAGLSRKAARAHAVSLMEKVGIADASRRADDYPHQFSGGMRQRAMIAMAISQQPRLLIADEPTTALDVTIQARIMALLTDLRDEYGMAMILISHDLGVVAEAADSAIVMYAGRAAESGPVRDVYDAPAHPYTAGLLASLPQEESAGARLTPIPGSPPTPGQLTEGCAFAPRCNRATALCRQDQPRSVSLNAGRAVACHHGLAPMRAAL
jgi:oligopeptide transport system ATP-binding protein